MMQGVFSNDTWRISEHLISRIDELLPWNAPMC
jgi:hypothetical protein